MKWIRSQLTHAALSAALVALQLAVADAADVEFNRDIRPILAENCFYCHGQDASKRQADLRLDVREVAIEHEAISPGDPRASGMIQRILSEAPESRMPPPSSNGQLSAEQRETLTQWIAQGAAYSTHWAFVAPQRPELPRVKSESWCRTPIDRFVLAKLDQAGLHPSPEADRTTLIRRLSIDLTGIPPSLAEVDQFVNDERADAYDILVDRLLASPHYGERMALDWLDAARYADSNGFQREGDTWQWMWRDWVVRSMNADLSFDQFSTWQLAGDLLPEATIDQRLASAFNRNHMLNGEGGAIPEEQRFVALFDRVDTTATTWLGLTIACAQCHDHKYDPVTQRDYYGLLDAFNRVPEVGTSRPYSPRVHLAPPVLELPTPENEVQLAALREQIAAAEKECAPVVEAAFQGWLAGTRDKQAPPSQTAAAAGGGANSSATVEAKDEPNNDETAQRAQFIEKIKPGLVAKLPALERAESLKKDLAKYDGEKVPRVMIMSDEKPRETHLLERGDYLKPLEQVLFATPAFLPPLPAGAPPNRLGIAQWLFAAEHPLTARVQANRMWQHFFGVGLVKTSEDLGVQGEYPVHRELLDWLAVEFRERGWSRKAMHRLIVTSATYRQSSRFNAPHVTNDAENRLLSRASRFRMPAMILRDWALASSGLLNRAVGGRPVYPYQPEDIWGGLTISKAQDFTYPTSSGADLYRRSLYTFWRRTVGPANMFDSSNRQTCRVRTGTTSTPLHALTMLNDPTWIEASRVLAEASIACANDTDEQLTYVFRSVLGRGPTERDLSTLRRTFDKQLRIYAADSPSATAFLAVGSAPRTPVGDPAQHAALSAVCLAIFNLDEAVTRE